MLQIEVLGSESKLNGKLLPAAATAIDEECRYHPDGYIHSKKYPKDWDGYLHLYRWGKFPTGLLSYIEMQLALHDLDYEVYDYRQTADPVEVPMTSTLRPHQIPLFDAGVAEKSGCISAATGSGKTILFLHLMAHWGVPAMILVPTIDLVTQTLKRMDEFSTVKGVHCTSKVIMDPRIAPPFWGVTTWQTIASLVRQYKAEKWKEPEEEDWPCLCGDIKKDHENEYKGKPNYDHDFSGIRLNILKANHKLDEARKKIKRIILEPKLAHYDTLIMDECHATAGAQKPAEAASWFNSRYRYGFSATPFHGEDTIRMFGATGPIIAELGASELIREGELVPAKIRFVQVPSKKLSSYKSWTSVYEEAVVQYDWRNERLVKEAVELAGKGRITLMMCQRIPHGQLLERMLNEYFDEDEVFFVSGKMPSKIRKEKTKDFHDGKVPIAISSNVWDQGVDFPMLSGIVMAGPYKSANRTKQRIGRGLRPYKDKEDCIVIDTFDQVPYLRDWSLERYDVYQDESEFEVSRS